jgi:hypothetical protein
VGHNLCSLLLPLLLCVALARADLSGALADRRGLEPVVRRDADVASERFLPTGMLSRLANYRVIAVGEGRHHVAAYEQVVTDLVLALHEAGVRQLLIEMPHAYDGEANAYAMGDRFDISAVLLQYSGTELRALRAFNRDLPAKERIAVRAIDVNHELSLYTYVLNGMATELALAGASTEVLAPVLGRELAGADISRVQAVYSDLLAQAGELVAAWGQETYDRILEMTWVQERSIHVRSGWTLDYAGAHAERERVIKALVERRLSEVGDAITVLHVGANHIQREHLMGIETEWVGGYLAERSISAAGKTFLLYLTAARGCYKANDGSIVRFRVGGMNATAELLDLLATIASFQHPDWTAAYLPLDDERFATTPIEVNYSGAVYTHNPKRQFDGYLLLRCIECGGR